MASTKEQINKVLTHLKAGVSDSGSVVSPDFRTFCREFKTMMLGQLKKVNGTDYIQNNGHYYISGFFKIKEQCYYISISDVRYFNINNILIRKCKDYKDFRGEVNHYFPIEDFMFRDIEYRV